MDRQYVGIDFHRRRSVIVRLSSAGERLAVHRVDNDPFALSAVMGEAGPAPAGGGGRDPWRGLGCCFVPGPRGPGAFAGAEAAELGGPAVSSAMSGTRAV